MKKKYETKIHFEIHTENDKSNINEF